MTASNIRVWSIGISNTNPPYFSVTLKYAGSTRSIWVGESSNPVYFYKVPETLFPFDYRELTGMLDFFSSSVFPKPVHTLTINYQYADGVEATDPAILQLEAGEAYSIPSPAIPGYIPDKPTVSGTMPDSDHTETVIYSPTTYRLTIHYRYENGAEAAPSYVQQLAPGAGYAVDSPVLDNCIASLLAVTGTMPQEDVTLTVTYTSDMYPLTIHYRYQGGLQAAGSITRLLSAGAEYSIPSPSISGYTADQPTVTGTMPAQGHTVTVTYTRNSSGGGTGPGGGSGSDPFDSPAWWQDFADPFQSPPLWQDTGDPFSAPPLFQDFDDPFNAPPLWQDFDDPFAKIFGRSFLENQGESS